MPAVSAVFRIIFGALFGLASGFALVPAFAAFSDGAGGNSWLIFVVVGLGAVLGFSAPTFRRALGRGFLFLGLCVLALPLSMTLLSSRVVGDMVNQAAGDEKAAAAVGSGIAGTLMTGMSAFVGFFLGAILIIIGLVLALGGRREVVIVGSHGQPISQPTVRRDPDDARLAAVDTSKWSKRDREAYQRQLERRGILSPPRSEPRL